MLLDTSGLLCFHHQAERQNAEAIRHMTAASRRLTHNYVLAEFVALAHARRLPREAALAFVSELQNNAAVEIVWVDAAMHQEALVFLKQRLDKAWSLCDAISFLLMRREGIAEALTTDHHFEQAGFVRLLTL